MLLDLPGVDPGSIDVSVENNTLTVRAERTGRSEENVQWLARERAIGTYVRQLTLGAGLSRDDIDATYPDGVLTLTIAMAEEAKPRRIEVTRVNAGQAIETQGSQQQEIQG
jgi:HSP20 family protein